MELYFTGDFSGLEQGVNALAGDYGFCRSENGLPVFVEQAADSSLLVAVSNGQGLIRYSRTIHFFRGLGLLLENMQNGKTEFRMEETPQFDTDGVMLDMSQGNAALPVDTVQHFLRRMAVMGLDMLMLYGEDGCKLDKYPYFSYFRGGYTEEQLRECDRYAALFGIEMVPCIQTLAHLSDPLRWPAFQELREDSDTLLVGEEKTYEFLRELISAAARPFRSRKIHVGMDEAWKLGLGAYLKRNGYLPSGRIMEQHLARVLEITRELGLEPMMWSDMFFRAAAPDGDYYNAGDFSRELLERMPRDVSLVYWDYYHQEEEFYTSYIQKHRLFGEPVFAGGIWSWYGYGVNWGLTFRTMDPALRACKRQGIRKVFATVWGDNGTECNEYANLLGMSFFAEHGYAAEVPEDMLARRFEFCTGGLYEDFLALRELDEAPGSEPDKVGQCNPSKYLMWQDLLTGLFDRNIEGLPLNGHYCRLAERFAAAAGRNGVYNRMFAFYQKVAEVLSVKAELGIQLTGAYRAGDRGALRGMAEQQLPDLLERVADLRRIHRENWFAMNQPFGWDVPDMRYGALLARIDSAREAVSGWLAGKTETIPELEAERLLYDGKQGLPSYVNWYGRIVSPSRIASEA